VDYRQTSQSKNTGLTTNWWPILLDHYNQHFECEKGMIVKIFIPTLLVFLSSASLGANNTVIDALPNSVVYSGSENTRRDMLGPEKKEEYRLTITKRDGRYYWSSREDRELTYRISGAFHIFMEVMGGGYITIFNLPESLRDGAGLEYKEHIRNFTGNITYWGETEIFAP
jgi:hypothetical protein